MPVEKPLKFCPFCNVEGLKVAMQFHHAYIFHAAFTPMVGMYARDEAWKCPRCRYVAKFGFPLTYEEYKAQQKEWGGDFDWAGESDEVVTKRLEALGYI